MRSLATDNAIVEQLASAGTLDSITRRVRTKGDAREDLLTVQYATHAPVARRQSSETGISSACRAVACCLLALFVLVSLVLTGMALYVEDPFMAGIAFSGGFIIVLVFKSIILYEHP